MSIIRSLLAFLLVSVDATPAIHRSIPVYVDDKFLVADDNKISEAIDAWNKRLLGYEKLEVVSFHSDLKISEIEDVIQHHGLILMRVNSDCVFRPHTDPAPVAWADSIGGTQIWFVRSDIPDGMFEIVVEHEIGHTLGASHQPHSANVMYPYTDPRMMVSCLEQSSADELAQAQGIPSVGGLCRR